MQWGWRARLELTVPELKILKLPYIGYSNDGEFFLKHPANHILISSSTLFPFIKTCSLVKRSVVIPRFSK
jgi:hypothetical protein